MKPPEDFGVLILTNNRPEKIYTYDTLIRSGYTGKIFIVIDDLDPSKEKYLSKFGSSCIVFNKKEAGKITDSGDNFGTLRGVVYARNASFEVARRVGLKYFIQLDDDYRHFQFRFNDKLDYGPKVLKDLDKVFASLLKFFIASKATSVAIAQGGDFIGGEGSPMAERIKLKRKCMNSFICCVDRPFKFMGRINEDVNAYTGPASRGLLFFTTNQVSLEQIQTQTNSGGLTEIYLDLGTYVKSFYSVIFYPSSIKVKVLRDRDNQRLHHSVSWRNTVPVILRENVKKYDK